MVPQSFLVLRFATAASATPPDDPTKPTQEVCSSRLYRSLRMAGLFRCRGGGAVQPRVEPSTLSSFTVSALPEAVLRHQPTSVLRPPRGPLSLGVESAPGTVANRDLGSRVGFLLKKQTYYA